MRTRLDSDLAERFDELFSVAFRSASRVTGSDVAAEDAAANAMLKLTSRWPGVRDHAPQWVARVAVNAAIDAHRRDRSAPLGTTREATAAEVDSAAALDVRAGLRRLPRRQREVVVLRYIADLSESETASVLGISNGTVKSHLARGLAALRNDERLCVGSETHEYPPPRSGQDPKSKVTP